MAPTAARPAAGLFVAQRKTAPADSGEPIRWRDL